MVIARRVLLVNPVKQRNYAEPTEDGKYLHGQVID
jgi:hypothetical protein